MADVARQRTNPSTVAVLMVALVGAAGLGWYFGVYRAGSEQESAGTQASANTTGLPAPSAGQVASNGPLRRSPGELGSSGVGSSGVGSSGVGSAVNTTNVHLTVNNLVFHNEVDVYVSPEAGEPTAHITGKASVHVLAAEGSWRRVRIEQQGEPQVTGWVQWVAIADDAPSAGTTADPRPGHAITGTVSFTGDAPEMKVPVKRAEHEVCKDEAVVYNAVVVQDGKLRDVYVGLEGDGQRQPPDVLAAAQITQRHCSYEPRLLAVLVEQELEIINDDATMHNINAKHGADLKFNFAQPKGAPLQRKAFDEPGIYRLQCDVHPWMRGFVIASAHPHFAVTGANGGYRILDVPDGEYTLYSWHSQYGRKEQRITVAGGTVAANFSYDGREPEPADNKGELNGLW